MQQKLHFFCFIIFFFIYLFIYLFFLFIYLFFFFFGGGGVVTLSKLLAENAYKCYHVYKGIVVLHIYNKSLVIRLAGHPANRNKSFLLRLF